MSAELALEVIQTFFAILAAVIAAAQLLQQWPRRCTKPSMIALSYDKH